MRKIVLIAAAAAVLVLGFVLARDTSDEQDDVKAAATTATATPTTRTAPEAKPAVPEVVVVDGKPDGGVAKLEFAKGDTIRFDVRSDVADEVHVHGFDVKKDVAAGGTASFAIPAKFDGRFEVELEGAGVQIAELQVDP